MLRSVVENAIVCLPQPLSLHYQRLLRREPNNHPAAAGLPRSNNSNLVRVGVDAAEDLAPATQAPDSIPHNNGPPSCLWTRIDAVCKQAAHLAMPLQSGQSGMAPDFKISAELG